MRKCYIYGIYNKSNPDNILYVGQHNFLRFNDGYMGSGKKLLELYSKNGKENFDKIIFENIEYNEESDKEVVGNLEKAYISFFKKKGQAELNISAGSNPSISSYLSEEELEKRIKRQKEYDKQRYEDNKDEIKKRSNEYYNNNKNFISKRNKEYRNKYKDKIRERNKKYRNEHKTEIREKKKDYRSKNKEIINLKKKEKYYENRDNILRRQKIVKYLKNNNEELFEQYKSLETTKQKKEFIENLLTKTD